MKPEELDPMPGNLKHYQVKVGENSEYLKPDYSKNMEQYGNMYFVKKEVFDGILERLTKLVSDLERENTSLREALVQIQAVKKEGE